MAYQGYPYIVSKGLETSFVYFSDMVSKGEFPEPSEQSYIDMISKVILFNNCDEIIKNLKFGGENLITTKIPFRVYKDEKGFYRIFHDHKLLRDKPYAIGRILSDTEEEIVFLPECRKFFSESHNTFSHIAFEELLLRHDAMILHAAFVNTEYGGVLFSGPSGVGKSTQADLWCKYKAAEQINGDRPILRKNKGQW